MGVVGAKAAITSSDAKLAALATKAVVLKEPEKSKEIVVAVK